MLSVRFWTQRKEWIPALLFALGLVLVLLLGLASHRNDVERIRLETRITAEQLKIRLESCFDIRRNLVRSLAVYPWQSVQQLTDTWAVRAGTLLPLQSGVQALNYVDPDGVIRVIHPVATNLAALNANLREHPSASVVEALNRAAADGLLVRTRILDLLQGGQGFAMYQPIFSRDGDMLGFVNGVFRVETLMESCLPEGRLRAHFAFAFFDGEQVFYSRPDPLANGDVTYQVSLPIEISSPNWQFTLAPLQSYLDATDNNVDEIWVALGILLISLLTLASHVLLKKQDDLEANTEKYRLLVENQTDLVVKVNPNGEFQYISPSYCDMFGKSEQELIGFQFMPLVHEDDRELTNRSLESLRLPPHTSYHEQRAMTRLGWRWLAWSNTAVLDDAGNIEAITAVGRDVTEVKRLEEHVAHTQKMRAMGELAGGITHDFNNLLQVILGNIEFLLLEDKHDADTRESLRQVRDIVERAMSLTQKLATLSRQQVTRQDVFDVNAFLRELQALLAHTLPASVELSLAPSPEPLYVYGDKAQLEQVMLNLCFNARDAIKSQGHIRLATARVAMDGKTPGTRPGQDPREFVLLTVEDDGCGIEAEILPRVFDPFFTTKGTDTGTGLGLANCYSIVEQHDGLITVDSEPGNGSCFSVYLPLASADATPVDTAERRHPVQAGNRGKLVLVVDDSPQLLKLTCQALESVGFDTLAAADGAEALALFEARQSEIRLIVMDLVMPGLGGEEVAERVRQLSDDVPVLFVSGYVPEHLGDSLQGPLIRKPFTIDALLDAVTELLSVN